LYSAIKSEDTEALERYRGAKSGEYGAGSAVKCLFLTSGFMSGHLSVGAFTAAQPSINCSGVVEP